MEQLHFPNLIAGLDDPFKSGLLSHWLFSSVSPKPLSSGLLEAQTSVCSIFRRLLLFPCTLLWNLLGVLLILHKV